MEIENQDIDITDKFSEECRQKFKHGVIESLALSPSENFDVRVMFNPETKETTFVADFGDGLKVEVKRRSDPAIIAMMINPQ